MKCKIKKNFLEGKIKLRQTALYFSASAKRQNENKTINIYIIFVAVVLYNSI